MTFITSLFKPERLVYTCAIIGSLLLSAWLDYREAVVNPDAICYLLSAETLGEQGLKAAMTLCAQSKWPFYSALIYSIAHYTPLSFQTAAYLLNGVLSTLTVAAFLLIICELGGSRLTLWLASAVILCAHEFIGVREYIVRDHGFWAFYLISMWYLLRYIKQHHAKEALAWSISLIIATLFRIEGIFFLLALPFAAFFYAPPRYKIKSFFTLNALPLLGLVSIGVWLGLHPAQSLAQFGRLIEVTQQISHGASLLVGQYQTLKLNLLKHVLNAESAQNAGVMLNLMLVFMYVLNVMDNLSWLYGVLAVYAMSRVVTLRQFSIPFAYLVVNVAITFTFLVERLFLSKRYLIALSLTLMLWAPFALADWYAQRANKKYRYALILTALLMLASLIGNLVDFGTSKRYLREAGDWLATNTPSQAVIYTNDLQLMYYSKHFGANIFSAYQQYHNQPLQAANVKQYDYVALRVFQDETPSFTFSKPPLKVFHNKSGDQVVIYQRILI